MYVTKNICSACNPIQGVVFWKNINFVEQRIFSLLRQPNILI